MTKPRSRGIFGWFCIVTLLLSSMSACTKRQVLIESSIPNDPIIIADSMISAELDYEWFSAKVGTEVTIQGEKKAFKTNLRLRRDSALWLSISPALGIEVARMLITKDSVKFIDKINDQYYLGDQAAISEKLGVKLDFDMLQDLMVGNAVLYDPTDDYISDEEDAHFLLFSNRSGQIRNVAEVIERDSTAGAERDSLTMEIDQKRYQRIMAKTDNLDELILRTYWVDKTNFKVAKSSVTDLATLRAIEVTCEDYLSLDDGQFLAQQLSYSFADLERSMSFEMTYNRVKLDEVTTFPFRIPEKFVRIE